MSFPKKRWCYVIAALTVIGGLSLVALWLYSTGGSTEPVTVYRLPDSRSHVSEYKEPPPSMANADEAAKTAEEKLAEVHYSLAEEKRRGTRMAFEIKRLKIKLAKSKQPDPFLDNKNVR